VLVYLVVQARFLNLRQMLSS